MTLSRNIILAGCLFLLARCSNTRFLTEDQILYTGRRTIEIRNPKDVKNLGPVKSYVKSVASGKVNNAVLGLRILPPVSLWIYNYMRPEEQNKLGNWLYNSLSKPPVLLSDINPDLRAQKIENELNNRGYLNTTTIAMTDTVNRNPKKAKVTYVVLLRSPYYYNRIIFDNPYDRPDSLLRGTPLGKTLKPGDRFDLGVLKKVKVSMAQHLQENSYYFFVPEYISVRADTNIGENKTDIFLGKKEDLPDKILSGYRIGKITLQLRKVAPQDYLPRDTLNFNQMTIISPGRIIRPGILHHCVTFRSGDPYSIASYQKTLMNLNNLGVFRLVNIFFDVPGNDTSLRKLDVRMEMLVPDNVSLDFESNLVSKSTGFLGPAISTGITHKNAFRGAEKLQVKLQGNVEWQLSGNYPGSRGSTSYEAGAHTGLVFTRLIIPFNLIRSDNLISQSTSIHGGFSLLNRTAFYRMNSIKAGLDYQWAISEKIRHTFYPLYLNSVELLKTTAEFDSVVNSNIYIKRSFEEQFVLGFRYEFSFNSKSIEKKDNYLFQAGVYTSGNLISLLSRKPDGNQTEPRTFLRNPYAQFVKLTTEFRYYRIGIAGSLAMRLYAGIGLPYGNSTVLPYVEQFFSGGAYSIRAFPARSLGPGSFHEDSEGYIDRSGDLRLEMNMEYRIKFSKLLNAALFIETGNVWLTRDDGKRPGAEFRSDNFIRQLAVGTGLGLRFDFNFFVLRTDLGLPLRSPYINNGRYWIENFRDMLRQSVFHLAVGYPF